MNQYDYIIVGSGIGGLYTALLARENGSVLIITKGSINDCNTRYAQGGIAAAIGKEDSSQLHVEDTVNAGDGLSDEEAVRILAGEASARIADLVNFRVPFDTLDGEIALTMEAAHSVSRVLHAGGAGGLLEAGDQRRGRGGHGGWCTGHLPLEGLRPGDHRSGSSGFPGVGGPDGGCEPHHTTSSQGGPRVVFS